MNNSVFILLAYVSFAFILASGAPTCHAVGLYDNHMLRHFEVERTSKGQATVSSSDERIIVDCRDGFTGRIGTVVELPKIEWWQYAHWTDLVAEISFEPDFDSKRRKQPRLLIESLDEEGQVVAEVCPFELTFEVDGMPLSDSSEKGMFGLGHDNNYIRELQRKSHIDHFAFDDLIVIPRAETDLNKRPFARKARVVIEFTNWTGKFVVERLTLSPFQLSEAQRERWRVKKTEFGGLAWWDPAYTAPDTASALLADTGHKLLSAAGMKQMRYVLRWGENDKDHQVNAEVRRGHYGFEKLDALLSELEYYGMGIGVMTVQSVPRWAVNIPDREVDEIYRKRSHKEPHPYRDLELGIAPDDWSDFDRFVKATVSHYKDKVKYWEVWNEPDGGTWAGDSSRKDYQQFLMRFYTAAKEADPQCKVICGRIGAWFPYALQDGMADFMDGIAIHPYTNNYGKEMVLKRYAQLQTAMIAADVFKPIMNTEVGIGARFPWDGPAYADSETQKASNVREIVGEMAKYSPIVYWYVPIQANRAYGLLQYERDRYIPQPAYTAYGELTGAFNGDSPIEVQIHLNNDTVDRGQKTTVELIATNISNDNVEVTFWPVGFIDSLGVSDLSAIRACDWVGTLRPGEEHRATIPIQPIDNAKGRYPIGLAVLTDAGNSVKMKDIRIRSPMSGSTVKFSDNAQDVGRDCVNDQFVPVFSGDRDIAFAEWKPTGKDDQPSWITIQMEQDTDVKGVRAYWKNGGTFAPPTNVEIETGDGRKCKLTKDSFTSVDEFSEYYLEKPVRCKCITMLFSSRDSNTFVGLGELEVRNQDLLGVSSLSRRLD